MNPSGIALIALGALSIMNPHQACAQGNARSYDFRTRMVEQTPSVGEFDGTLELRISADGIVSGFYRPDTNARIVPVNGGLTDHRLWLDIGTFAKRPLHFSGSFENGMINADSDWPFLDGDRYTALTLIGTPKTSQ